MGDVFFPCGGSSIGGLLGRARTSGALLSFGGY